MYPAERGGRAGAGEAIVFTVGLRSFVLEVYTRVTGSIGGVASDGLMTLPVIIFAMPIAIGGLGYHSFVVLSVA